MVMEKDGGGGGGTGSGATRLSADGWAAAGVTKGKDEVMETQR